MFSRIHIAIGLALLFTLGFAVPVLGGGWAVITLDELPLDVVTDKQLTVGFTVLQHGRTPMTNLEPSVTTRSPSGKEMTFDATPDGAPGHYEATLMLPEEGEWEWSIQAFTMNQPMPVLTAAASSVASTSLPVKPEPVWASISPLLILRTLALGIGLIGLVIAFRQRGRTAMTLTALCLLVAFALFIAEAGSASGLEAPNKLSSEALINSSLSKVELGRQLFLAKGCITCHVNSRASLGSEYWTVPVGTNLSNFSANPEVLFMRLKDPASVKSDTQMPNLELTKVEIEALVAFINSK